MEKRKMSHVKIYATEKSTGQRKEITDLYWFEENGVHDLTGDGHYGDNWSFEIEVDGVAHKVTSCTEWRP